MGIGCDVTHRGTRLLPMIFSAPDPAADPYFASVLLNLQREAFEIEAQFLGTRDIPPLRQSPEALAGFRGSWVMAWDGTMLIGAAAWQETPSEVELEKVMVHPSAHRRGVASALIAQVVERTPGRDIVVTTGRDNPPGIAMYTRNGFVAEGDEEVPPGIWLRHLRLSSG